MELPLTFSIILALILIKGVQESSDCSGWSITDCYTKEHLSEHGKFCYKNEGGDYKLCSVLCKDGPSSQCKGYCGRYATSCVTQEKTTPPLCKPCPTTVCNITNTTSENNTVGGTNTSSATVNEKTMSDLAFVFIALTAILFVILPLAVGFDSRTFKGRVKTIWECIKCRKNAKNLPVVDEGTTDPPTSAADRDAERNQINSERADNFQLKEKRPTSCSVHPNDETDQSQIKVGSASKNEDKSDKGGEQSCSTPAAPPTRTGVMPASTSSSRSMDTLMQRLLEAKDLHAYIRVLHDYIKEMDNRKKENPIYWSKIERIWNVVWQEDFSPGRKQKPKVKRMISHEGSASSQQQPQTKTGNIAQEEQQKLLSDQPDSLVGVESASEFTDMHFTDIKLYDIKLLIMGHWPNIAAVSPEDQVSAMLERIYHISNYDQKQQLTPNLQ